MEENSKELKEKLFNQKELGWNSINDREKEAIYTFSNGYMNFLNKAKIEREFVISAKEMAEQNGFRDITKCEFLKPGDKVYYINRDKSMYLAVIGTEKLENGLQIVGAHIDSPRLDLKPNPLYEDTGFAYFKTHYYGGIKKYQWTTIPLSIHGVIAKANGEKILVNIGEDENREEACKRVKQIAKVIEKIKINNYLKIGGISEEDKQRLEQLESSMNIVANENGLQKLASQLSTKISERYDIESEQSETQQDEQNSIKDRLEAYRGAIDAEVQALKIGKISKAKRCQKRANMLIQQLEKDDIQRAVEYKRGVLAGLNVSLDISTEKVQVWLNRFKGCWREEDFNKRKTITQEITNITQTKTEEKSTKELFAGVEI